MQYDELNDYMQLKRWIWNDFWTDMNQLFKKKKTNNQTNPFLKKMYSKFWQTVQYTNPNFTWSKKLYKTPSMA